MGQGGKFLIVNHTPYDWKLIDKSSYQMDAWDFPKTIEKCSTKSVYVEWDESIFHNNADDSGKATYSLNDGSGDSFTIKFHNAQTRDIEVDISNITRKHSNRKSNKFKLEWNHNGNMNFGISGKLGKYTVMGDDYSQWMGDNYEDIASKSLIKMAMLGSHDSGMSEFGASAGGATKNTTITQDFDIEGQLNLGTRYFDIRPVISGGKFYTGHYNFGMPNCGANGQILSSIISQLNEFLKDKRELVILRISHAGNTDVGYGKYRAFEENEWQDLLNQLEGIKFRYSNKNKNLLNNNMEEFIKNGSSVIVLLGADDEEGEYETIKKVLLEKPRSGFYLKEELPVYDKYSDCKNYDEMKDDQLKKLNDSINHRNKLFLLSWTLTQDGLAAFVSTFGLYSSILEMAETANSGLCEELYKNMRDEKMYPNVIYLDKIDSSMGAFMANVVNEGFINK